MMSKSRQERKKKSHFRQCRRPCRERWGHRCASHEKYSDLESRKRCYHYSPEFSREFASQSSSHSSTFHWTPPAPRIPSPPTRRESSSVPFRSTPDRARSTPSSRIENSKSMDAVSKPSHRTAEKSVEFEIENGKDSVGGNRFLTGEKRVEKRREKLVGPLRQSLELSSSFFLLYPASLDFRFLRSLRNYELAWSKTKYI